MKNINERIAKLPPEKRALFEQKMKAAGIEFDFVRIPRADNNDSVPLSYSQKRIWYQQQLAPTSNYYNEPILAIDIKNELSVSVLRQAIDFIVERHEVLRMAFPSIAGQPITIVKSVEPVPFIVKDLSHLSETAQEETIQDILEEEESRRFDLSRGPLFFVTLICRSRHHFLLLVSTHHIVFDGWSLRILLNELQTIYVNLIQKGTPDLRPLPIQYRDYTQWQNTRLTGEYLEQLTDYWTSVVRHTESDNKVVPPATSYSGCSFRFSLDEGTTEQIHAMCQEENCTLFMFLHTVFSLFIYQHFKLPHFNIGIPVSGRNHPDTEELIGFFVNTLVIGHSFEQSMSFRQRLRSVRQQILKAFEHDEFPFDLLVQALGVERLSGGRQPLFRFMHVHHNYRHGHYQQHRKTVHLNLSEKGHDQLPVMTRMDLPSTQAKFELTFISDDASAEALLLELNYDRSLFEYDEVKAMEDSLMNILRQSLVSVNNIS
ncbi:condensation domain-containing protein [Vibrio mangrovi]|uniref:Condensation domain-containing protein n=1 Tax=Vibrio mangrovi TaxID=474394 RepID=A0A1Y6IWX3_9VIBR|nr:condensation domain-containing protein [Vibrio mangrovi]MDW6005406.1 condensation domain-containing protein [Vibrio mangrovi]SMS02154.1 Linear gramicidin synthase subunit D [Vibrio mangrovi]